jgi:hypothetical protein
VGLWNSPFAGRAGVIDRPQLRFLLRGSLLLIGILSLWWFALRTPLLAALRVFEEAATPAVISVNESGDWDFRMPVNDIHQESTGLVRVRHVEFTMQRSDVTLFTFSLPVFWAMLLAAPFRRVPIYGLLWGTLAMMLFEVLLLFSAVGLNTQAMVAHWHPGDDVWWKWWRQFAGYLVTGVVPFFAPMFLAIAFSRELRTMILQFAGPAAKRSPQQAKRRTAAKA